MHANDFCERAMQRHGDARLLGKLHARYDRIGYLPLQTGVCAFAAAWNKGKLIGQKAPLKLREIWGERVRMQPARRARDLALFNLGIDSKLRGCDLVGLPVCDVAPGGRLARYSCSSTARQGHSVADREHDAVHSLVQGNLVIEISNDNRALIGIKRINHAPEA